MQPRDNLALVITGSVAAVKTFLLIDALLAKGFTLRFIVTPAAWPFLCAEGKYKATAEQLIALEKEAKADPVGVIKSSAAILISPASADFIRQIALGDTTLGDMIKNSSKPVWIVPAMNFMMWNHPAVQKNIRTLLDRGVKFIGPAYGDMACGDHGYGRMVEPLDIAAAVAGESTALINDPKTLIEKPLLPTRARKPCRKILLVVTAWEDAVVTRIQDWQRQGFDVRCVAADKNHAEQLEKITGHPVCFDHFQLYPKDGMEHIWLAEDADVVVMYPLTRAFAVEMAKGAAESFIGCLYLATKRPVIVVPRDCASVDMAAIASHGAAVIDEARIPNAVARLEQDIASGFEGKKFLVLGGRTRETVDSFRFYTNALRPEDHGQRVAEELHAQGAEVTLIESASVVEMLAACRALAVKKFETVIQLAGISQFTCPAPVAHKIRKTGAERAKLFEVAGNIDIMKELRDIFGAGRVMGFDQYQQWVDGVETPLKHKIVSFVRRESFPLKPSFRRKPESCRVESEIPACAGMTAKCKVLITTGRTEETLTTDGVIITNGFTGRQGQEIARAFAERGAEVVLVSGPTALPDVDHPRVRTAHVTSMPQMMDAVMSGIAARPDIYVSAAAIADFGMEKPLPTRLKPGDTITLPMRENASIVSAVTQHENRPKIVVSFAAQSPESVLDYAQEKFALLGVDLTIANPIGGNSATTRDSTRNEVYFITRQGVEKHAEMPKVEAAKLIVEKISALLSS